MSTDRSTYQLLTWLSPAYPVGAYTFSHGLEAAIEQGFVNDAAETARWLADLLRFGDGQADLVFLANAWRAHDQVERLFEINQFALAFQPSAEIRKETLAQGNAFLKATAAAWPCDSVLALLDLADGNCTYPVAVAAAAGGHGIALERTMWAYAQAVIANLVSAALRLVPLGQTDGQHIMAEMLDVAESVVPTASSTEFHEVTSSCFMADILSMQHEVQYTRLFQS